MHERKIRVWQAIANLTTSIAITSFAAAYLIWRTPDISGSAISLGIALIFSVGAIISHIKSIGDSNSRLSLGQTYALLMGKEFKNPWESENYVRNSSAGADSDNGLFVQTNFLIQYAGQAGLLRMEGIPRTIREGEMEFVKEITPSFFHNATPYYRPDNILSFGGNTTNKYGFRNVVVFEEDVKALKKKFPDPVKFWDQTFGGNSGQK